MLDFGAEGPLKSSTTKNILEAKTEKIEYRSEYLLKVDGREIARKCLHKYTEARVRSVDSDNSDFCLARRVLLVMSLVVSPTEVATGGERCRLLSQQ